jgi:hypothetical protein
MSARAPRVTPTDESRHRWFEAHEDGEARGDVSRSVLSTFMVATRGLSTIARRASGSRSGPDEFEGQSVVEVDVVGGSAGRLG